MKSQTEAAVAAFERLWRKKHQMEKTQRELDAEKE